MSFELVGKLRGVSEDFRSGNAAKAHAHVATVFVADLTREAAVEIERLRGDVDKLAAELLKANASARDLFISGNALIGERTAAWETCRVVQTENDLLRRTIASMRASDHVGCECRTCAKRGQDLHGIVGALSVLGWSIDWSKGCAPIVIRLVAIVKRAGATDDPYAPRDESEGDEVQP